MNQSLVINQGLNQEIHVSINYHHSQYLSITRDDGLETRGVFLDISKAFDKIWHEGLLFKFKQNGISGNLLNVITDFCIRENKELF